jgi:hypothetical protein
MRYECEPHPSSDDDDAGISYDWSSVTKLPGELYDIWSDGSRVVLATGGVVVVRNGNTEVLWTASEVGFNGLWGSTDGLVFAVGADNVPATPQGLVVRCGEESCDRLDVQENGTLFGVHGFSDTDVFAVGSTVESCGFVLHYDGSDWKKMELPSCIDARGIWGAAHDDLWVVGTDWSSGQAVGRVFHYNGEEWDADRTEAPVGLVAIGGANARDVYAVGIDENALYTGGTYGVLMHFDGTNWKVSPGDVGYTSLFVSADRTVWLGALRQRLLEKDAVPEIHKLVGGKASIMTVENSDGIVAIEGIWIGADGTGLAVGREGELLKLDSK